MVVNAKDLSNWIEANKYDPVTPPPPPPPEDDFHKLAWPSEWMPPYITQWFGINRHIYSQYGLPGHEGIDIRAPDGYEIYSVFAGEIYRVETSDTGAYGIQVRIKHETPDGLFKSIYAHLKNLAPAVVEGNLIEAGALLGQADNTGNSFGAHLHLSIKLVGSNSWLSEHSNTPNEMINPVPYFPQLFVPGAVWKVVVAGNFRNTPNLVGSPIRLLQSGERIVILDHKTEWCDWWKIRAGSRDGYFWNPGYKLDRV